MKKNQETKPNINKRSWILRGCIVRLRRKCGQKKCRCLQGELHETWVLSVKVHGRTQLITLRDEDLPVVQRALSRHREASSKLEERVQESMAQLRQWRQYRKKALSK